MEPSSLCEAAPRRVQAVGFAGDRERQRLLIPLQVSSLLPMTPKGHSRSQGEEPQHLRVESRAAGFFFFAFARICFNLLAKRLDFYLMSLVISDEKLPFFSLFFFRSLQILSSEKIRS